MYNDSSSKIPQFYSTGVFNAEFNCTGNPLTPPMGALNNNGWAGPLLWHSHLGLRESSDHLHLGDRLVNKTERQSKSPKTAWRGSSQVLPHTRNIFLPRTRSRTETAPTGPSFKQGVDSSSLKIPPFNTHKYKKTAHTHVCAGQLCSSNMWLLFLLRGQHKRHLLSCCLY